MSSINKPNNNQQQNKKAKWKKQSEEFRAVIKNSTQTGTGSKFVNVPSSNDDYVHCQYCSRKYNEQAYNKHLNF